MKDKLLEHIRQYKVELFKCLLLIVTYAYFNGRYASENYGENTKSGLEGLDFALVMIGVILAILIVMVIINTIKRTKHINIMSNFPINIIVYGLEGTLAGSLIGYANYDRAGGIISLAMMVHLLAVMLLIFGSFAYIYTSIMTEKNDRLDRQKREEDNCKREKAQEEKEVIDGYLSEVSKYRSNLNRPHIRTYDLVKELYSSNYKTKVQKNSDFLKKAVSFRDFAYKLPSDHVNRSFDSLMNSLNGLIKGFKAEDQIVEYVNKIKLDYFDGVVIADEEGNKVEIDMIIPFKEALIAVEIKNYNADEIVLESSGYLYRRHGNEEKSIATLDQVLRHRTVLKNVLGDIDIINIIVFHDPNTKIVDRFNQPTLKVVHTSGLAFIIDSYHQDASLTTSVREKLETFKAEENKFSLPDLEYYVDKYETTIKEDISSLELKVKQIDHIKNQEEAETELLDYIVENRSYDPEVHEQVYAKHGATLLKTFEKCSIEELPLNILHDQYNEIRQEFDQNKKSYLNDNQKKIDMLRTIGESVQNI